MTATKNTAATSERPNGQARELTEAELAPISGGTGSGAGKIKFNEFSIKKTTDAASPVFF
jgi:hypothetical protein